MRRYQTRQEAEADRAPSEWILGPCAGFYSIRPQHERTFLQVTAMRKYGGGFASKLADAWFVADQTNRNLIEIGWAEMITSYDRYIKFDGTIL